MGTIAALRRDAARAAIAAILALCGCSSAQDVLAPSAITPPAQAASGASQPPASQPPGGAPSASQPQQIANAAIADARVRFAPIVGTSVEAANALSAGLSSRARTRGVNLSGAAVEPTHLLRGYFTPLVEAGQTTVIFVWDVYDPAGNRVHRISGQQKSESAGGEGWGAVPAASMRAIADSTIDQLAAWLSSRTG